MLSAPAIAFNFDDDVATLHSPKVYRAATASANSWDVTSIGCSFDWTDVGTDCQESNLQEKKLESVIWLLQQNQNHHSARSELESDLLPEIFCPESALHTRAAIAAKMSIPLILSNHLTVTPSPTASSPPPCLPPSRSLSLPHLRRRSSRRRVSLIASRVSIAPIEPPTSPPMLPQNLKYAESNSSFINTSASTCPPCPSEERTFLGERSISEFVIKGEIGRGAYGLVKRGHEIYANGSLGPLLVIKQVIKSRILADCWKKHPIHGTIPIEIYVMSAISNTPYLLPRRRPWDPSRLNTRTKTSTGESNNQDWAEGKTVKGHPNICPLLDFFEDGHYFYLILPSSTPEQRPDKLSVPSDLFDLVESFPQGLPASSIRSYLGQIADALAFLHSQGIVHRDVKDENVVLGLNGKCILIDFGSSGLIKKGGWDTFSGTFNYAGPEILRGEQYFGKEQDVWAFGIVAYVLLVGECPFMTMEEVQDGLESPFANASIALDERCGEGKEKGEETDGGGALGDAAALVRACLQVNVAARPTFERILQCRFLSGDKGWVF